MSDMVERVEAAIIAKLEERFGVLIFNGLGDIGRAAIEAMREPTTEMLRGLLVHRGYDPDAKEETLDRLGQLDIATMGALVGNYHAMIDAALSNPPIVTQPPAKSASGSDNSPTSPTPQVVSGCLSGAK